MSNRSSVFFKARGLSRRAGLSSRPALVAAGGYLWDRAAASGVSYRSYGGFTTSPTAKGPGKAKVKGLEGHFDPEFHSFDMGYPDVKRAERFISELQRFEKEGEMPRLQIVRQPNDHTSGASPGKPTPVCTQTWTGICLAKGKTRAKPSKM